MIRPARLLFHIAFLLTVLISSGEAYGAVSGTVIDSGGSPIEGATVVALADETDLERRHRWLRTDPSPEAIAEATTDSKGNYTLDLDQHLSRVSLEISAPGRVPQGVQVPHDGWIGTTLLADAKTVEGRVLSGGDPVAGASIILSGPFHAEIRARADDDGRFSIPQIPALFTTIAVVHPDYAPFSQQRFRGKDDLTIRLEPGVSLSGTTVAADGETPIEDVRVVIDGWPLGASDEDGRFTIEHAPRQWAQARLSKGTLIAAVSRSTARSTTVPLRRAATVSGTVVDAESGRAVPQVSVTLSEEGRFDGSVRRSTYTDSSGRFTFPATLPGAYELSASHPSWTGPFATVTVVGNGDVERKVEVTRTATARGRTVDQHGKAVVAAGIAIEPEERRGFRMLRGLDRVRATHSAPDGRFVVFGIEAENPLRLVGTHRLHPAAKSDRLELDPGETAGGTTIVFPPGVSLSGVVTTSSGDPIVGAEIRVSESDRGGPGGSRIMMIRAIRGTDQPSLTDARGQFKVSVEDGTWDIAVSAEGFAPRRLNAVETRGGTEPLEIVLEEGAVVQGRVVRAGVGIPDVIVNAMNAGIPAPVTTGTDGSFTIVDLPRGPVTVMAFKPAEMIQEMRMVEAPVNDLVIEIPPGGSIRGRVIDEATGEPIPDFQAGPSPDRGSGPVRMRFGGGSLQSFHSEAGEFLIENVTPGSVQLTVEAPGFVQKTVKGIEIVEGETVEGVEVELSRGVRVTGTVRGDDGQQLSGVSVRIEANEEDPFAAMMPELLSEASTDSSGQYTIAAAPPGETTLVFSREGFIPTRKSTELKGPETRVDATLSAGASVSGIVVTAAGTPVSGASVRAMSALQDTGRKSAETDATGQFTIEGLATGRYTFVANHPRHVQATSEDVEVGTGEQVRLVMEEGGTIVGRILGAEPSSYETINVYARGGGGSGTNSSPVSPDGTFRIEGVQPGTVQVMARMGRIFNNRSSENATVEVTAGSQASVDLQFTDGATVSGRITKFGEPLRSGFVRLARRGGARSDNSTSIDSDGRYSIGGLEYGTYDLFVIDMQTRAPYSETIEVTSDAQTVDIDIRGGSISGRISDATSGQPVENANISLDADGGQDRRPIRLGASTGSTGEFVIDSVPEGNYSLRVERSGYGHATRNVFVSEERTETIEISLQPDEGLSLRVVDRRDGRPLAAYITVYDAQNAVAWEGQPSPREDGTIRIPVSSGTYEVTASASGYAPSTVRVSSVGTTETIALSVGGTLVIEAGNASTVRAKLVDSWGMPHRTSRWNRSGEITIVPGTNRLENLAPGQYTLQILNDAGTPVRSETVVIREGETASLSL